MHIHGPQVNPNIQFMAAYAARQAQAKREAAAVRKKLMESASKLAGGSAEDTLTVRARQENADGQSKKRKQKGGEEDGIKQGNAVSQISDWA